MKGGAHPGELDLEQPRDNVDKYQIPEFAEPTNNPMIPTEQKRIFAQNYDKSKSMAATAQTKRNEPLLNLQLYQAKPPPKQTGTAQQAYPHPAVFYPNYVANPFNPMEFANYMNYARMGAIGPFGPYTGPSYKEYNININGVSGSHVKTSMLFEDVLPGTKNIGSRYTSLGERKTIYEYIRSIMFSKGDGEDLPIDDSNYNLLSHLKFMDMNPYNASRFSRNPYRGLPYGLLLFRSCYPIRHNERTATAICAKNSTGINVRIYRMVEGAFKINKNKRKMEDYDMWRDIAFYEYIKSQIIKPKICPNFIVMFGYNITLDSKIDFETIHNVNKLGGVRPRPRPGAEQMAAAAAITVNPIPATAAAINKAHKAANTAAAKEFGIVRQPAAPGTPGYPLAGTIEDPRYSKLFVEVPEDPDLMGCDRSFMDMGRVKPKPTNIEVEETRKKIEGELDTYRGKALVCLTEAANYTLMGWAKKEYRAEGNVKRMINTGYHPTHVWESVIFQILAALYTMQIKGIVIRGFKLDRNVFIKDIELHNKSTTYWKYKIEGIDYYVPNYGYLVLIDTNYRDFDDDVPCDKETDITRLRKIDGLMVDTTMVPADITAHVFDTFRECVDPNIFDQDFINDDGIKPPEDILKLLSTIKADADAKNSSNISDYIRRHMTMFIHNRVGSLLIADEMTKILEGAAKEFNKGELAVMKDSNNNTRFVIHVSSSNNVSRIITRDTIKPGSIIIEKDVPTSSMIKYSAVNLPDQTFDMEKSSLNNEPIETYVISMA